jgi:NADPH:quinone reductase-like Zn-dependent oxidoreductase
MNSNMMQAWQLQGEEAPYQLALASVPIPVPGPHEALVQVRAAALNHRDVWMVDGKYPGTKTNVTLGSDGCGVVVEVGSNAHEDWLGKEVVLNPNVGWGDDPRCQSKDYSILGNPTPGTFAEFVAVPMDRLHLKPAHLSVQEAAALPLGGLTAYRAVVGQGGVSKDDVVLISGFGGGVAQFAFQFAKAMGAKVFVTSGSRNKLQQATKMGAAGAVNYRDADWAQQLQRLSGGGFTLAIDSAGGAQLNALVRLMLPAGRIVCYGATLGRPEHLDLHRIFYYQLRLQGSTMGSDAEFLQMLEFVGKHQIKPVLDGALPFKEAPQAFARMKAGEQLGKIVLQVADASMVGKLKQRLARLVNKGLSLM